MEDGEEVCLANERSSDEPVKHAGLSAVIGAIVVIVGVVVLPNNR